MFEKLKFWKKEGELPGTDLKEFSKPFDLGPLPTFDDDGTAGFAGTSTLSKPATVEIPSKYSTEQMAGAGGLTPVGPRMHQEQQYYPQQPQQMPHQDTTTKDYEIISAKLDAIRTAIDFLNQRLDNIDQMLRQRRGGW